MEKQSFLEFSKDKKLDGLLLLTGKRKKFPVFSILLGQYVYGLVKEDILNHRYPYRNGEFHWYSLQEPLGQCLCVLGQHNIDVDVRLMLLPFSFH